MYVPFYTRFIAGNNLKSAIQISKNLKRKKVGVIFDFSVESSKHLKRNRIEILKQTKELESSFIALKLSSLGIDNKSNCLKFIDELNKLNNQKEKPNKYLIDAENYKIQNDINDISNYAIENYNDKYKKTFFKTIQMYRKDSLNILKKDLEIYGENEKYALKIVRGAYMYGDKNYDIILNTKMETDKSFNNGIKTYLELMNKFNNNELIVATHNYESYQLCKNIIKKNNLELNNIYFATLMGMGNKICFDNENLQKLKYIPYGPFMEVFPYLFRRLIENKDILQHF